MRGKNPKFGLIKMHEVQLVTSLHSHYTVPFGGKQLYAEHARIRNYTPQKFKA